MWSNLLRPLGLLGCSCIELWAELFWPLDKFLFPLWSPVKELEIVSVSMFVVLCFLFTFSWDPPDLHLTSASGHHTTHPPSRVSGRPVCMCGHVLGLASSSVQKDEVVNLHVCTQCQDGRWELTLALDESVACFTWKDDSWVRFGERDQEHSQWLNRGAKWL